MNMGEDPNVNSINKKKLAQNNILQHAQVNRNVNKVTNPNLKLDYFRGVVVIIIQEVISQIKVNV